MKQTILKHLIKVKNLPTLPEVMTKILHTIDSDKSSAKDLGNVISNDQSVASRVLRLANSAYFGVSRTIDTVHSAIVIIGFNTVRQLALATTTYLAFNAPNQTGLLNKGKFWRHSIASAKAAALIATKCNLPNRDRLFTAGLLHDIGRIVLDMIYHEKYQEILKKVEEDGIALTDAEKSEFEMDHAEIGGFLSNRWHFPEGLREPIGFHHAIHGAKRQYRTSSAVICLASHMSRKAGIGFSGYDNDPAPKPEVYRLLNLRTTTFENMVNEIKSHEDEVEAILGEINSTRKVAP